MSTISALKAAYYTRRNEVLLAAVIFLVASLSFGLGYLANRELNGTPIVIEQCSQK